MAQALPLPKYHQIYLVLREQLHEGRFAQGLPGELALMRQFGVARVTVRRALEARGRRLIDARGVARHAAADNAGPRQRRSAAAPQTKTTRLTGLLENLVSTSLNTTVRVLEVSTVGATVEVARGAAASAAIRCRRRCGCAPPPGPLSHITTWVPADLARTASASWRRSRSWCCWRSPACASVAPSRPSRRSSPMPRSRPSSAWRSAPRCSRCARLIHDEQAGPLHGLYRPDRYEYQLQLSRVGDIDAKVWVSRQVSAQFH